jgi:hypothetical protein
MFGWDWLGIYTEENRVQLAGVVKFPSDQMYKFRVRNQRSAETILLYNFYVAWNVLHTECGVPWRFGRFYVKSEKCSSQKFDTS